MASLDQPSPLFNKQTDWHGYMLYLNCTAWMFKMLMESDLIMAIMRFVPEVIWYAVIWTTPLERFYDMVLKFFDCSSGRPVVIPKLRNKAYLSAKTLLVIQRKCIDNESDKAVLKSISSQQGDYGKSRAFQQQQPDVWVKGNNKVKWAAASLGIIRRHEPECQQSDPGLKQWETLR